MSGDLAARAQRALRLGAGPFPPVQLHLESAAIVVGRVVARGTSDPVVAQVALRPAPGALAPDVIVEEPPRFARTDDGGAFRIEGVPHGRWTAEAYAPSWVAAGTLEFDAGKSPLVLEVTAGGVIEGTVVDGDGRPVAGAALSAWSPGAAGEGRLVSADAEADRLRRYAGLGRAAAPAPAPDLPVGVDPRFVPRGELGVLLGPIPMPPPPGAVAARRATIVDDGLAVAAAAGAAAGGDAGVPAGPAPLPIDPDHAPVWITGADGRFRLPGLARGAWTVVADAPGYAEARSHPVEVGPGRHADVRLVVSRGVFVTGTVTDQHRDPVVGATVTVELAGGARARAALATSAPLEAITAEDGTYRLGPVVGKVHLGATAYGHADAERELDLAAPDGDARDEHVDLVLVIADGAVEGELDDPTGLPVAGAHLVVVGGAGADVASGARRTTTDQAGRFRIGSLPPGKVALRVEADGFPVQALETPTETDLHLTIALGGGLEGLVFDRLTGEPIAGAAITATGPGGQRRDAETPAGGRLSLVPLTAGAWHVRVTLTGYLPTSRTVDVPVGDWPGQVTVRDLRFELERGALLGGVVRDRFGSRLPGASVTVRRAGAGAGDDATATGRTDADGAFRLVDVPTGELEVTVEKDALRGAATLTLRPGDEYLSLQIEAK